MTVIPLVQKAKEIATGVVNDVRSNFLSEEEKKIDPIEIMANERLEICKKCEFFVTRDLLPDTIINTNNYTSFSQCTKCGCVGRFKVRSPESYCPEGKWNKQTTP